MAANTDLLSIESDLRRAHVNRNRAKSFYFLARAIGIDPRPANVKGFFDDRKNRAWSVSADVEQFVRAYAEGTGGAWGTEGGRALFEAAIGEVAHLDGLSILGLFARTISTTLHRVLVATGFSAGTVAQGLPKVVRNIDPEDLAVDPLKVVSLLVLTKELLLITDGAARSLFEREMRKALVAGVNSQIPRAFINFGTTTATAGADFRSTLQAMLALAEPSAGFILFAPAGTVQSAAADENTVNMTPQGGEYSPGVFVLPWEPDSSDPDLVLVPAGQCALKDYGAAIETAGHASVEMLDSPTNDSITPTPTTLVSLWQDNAVGLLVERSFALVPSAPAVTADLPA